MKKAIDTKKIFTDPPKSRTERVLLFITMLVVFVFFFYPLQFSEIHPVEAILISMLPSISISWAWIVWLRFMFRRSMYIKK